MTRLLKSRILSYKFTHTHTHKGIYKISFLIKVNTISDTDVANCAFVLLDKFINNLVPSIISSSYDDEQ